MDAVNKSYTVQTRRHPYALFVLSLIVPTFKQHAQTNYDRLWQVQKFLLLIEYSADDHLFHQTETGMDINNSLWYYHHLCLSCIFLDCGFICLSFNSHIVWWAVPVGTRELSLWNNFLLILISICLLTGDITMNYNGCTVVIHTVILMARWFCSIE